MNSSLGNTIIHHLLRSDVDGPRVIESRTFPLKVHAGPWSELDVLLAAGVPAMPGFYLLTGPSAKGSGVLAARPGEAGDLRRRLLEHAQDATKSHYEEVYCVSSVDARMSKSDVRYLEARCHEVIAGSSHAVLQVDKVPPVNYCPPAERSVLEGLLSQARDLLYAAGCRALDAPRAVLPSLPLLDERDDGSIEIVQSPGVHPDEHCLSYDGVWAWGHPVPDGFVVRAGSDVRRRENSALMPAVASRRRRLAELGLLGAMPGVTDRWRLLSNIKVPSLLLAAKVITGAHVSSRGIWQRLAPGARIVSMEDVGA